MNIIIILAMVAVMALLFAGALVVAHKAPTFRRPPPADGRERLEPRR